MFKKLIFMLMVLAVVGLAVPASAADYWVVGDWDVNGVPGINQQMTDNSDGTFTAGLAGLGAGARKEFKFWESEMESWYPGAPGNSWLYADGDGAVTVGLNTNTVVDGWLCQAMRIGLSTDGNDGGWVIAGSFSNYPGWSTTGIPMAPQGGGIYKVSLALPMGSGPDWIGDPNFNTFAWKAVVTGTWDSIAEDTRAVNTANAVFEITPGWQVVDFYVDAYTGVVKAEIVEGIPEPATIALLGLGGLALIRRKR